MKKLNIGLIGYGFMGRTHSNAFLQAPQLLRPAVPAGAEGGLRAQCRDAQERSPRTGATSRSRPTGGSWSSARTSTSIDIASPNDTHAEIAIAAAKAGKMVLCEKPLGAERGRSAGDGRRRSRRPACRTWSGTTTAACPAVTLAKQLIDEGRLGRIFHYRAKFLQDWTISHRPAAGRRRAVAARRRRRRQRRHRRPARALHRHRALAERPDHRRHRDDRDVHQGAQAQPDRQGRAGRHRRRQRVPLPVRERLAGDCSSRPATPAATRRSTRSRSTASTRRSRWDLHDLHRLQYFDHRDEGRVRGWRSIHVTDGDHPYMKHWWVPGLQIGYEHTFVHQVADFLDGRGDGKSLRADVPRRPGDRLRHRRRAEVGEDRQWEKVAPRPLNRKESRCPRRRSCALVRLRSRSFAGSVSPPAAAPRAGSRQPPRAQPPRQPPPGRAAAAPAAAVRAAPLRSIADHTGFEQIFDGVSMKGWDGDPAFWRAEGGALVGQTTDANPLKENTFLIWRGGEPADFELKVEYRMNATNSGIQFRSVQLPPGTTRAIRTTIAGKWVLKGYQADIDFANQFTGRSTRSAAAASSRCAARRSTSDPTAEPKVDRQSRTHGRRAEGAHQGGRLEPGPPHRARQHDHQDPERPRHRACSSTTM